MKRLLFYTLNERVFAEFYYKDGKYYVFVYFRLTGTTKMECSENYDFIRGIYSCMIH